MIEMRKRTLLSSKCFHSANGTCGIQSLSHLEALNIYSANEATLWLRARMLIPDLALRRKELE